MTTANASGVFRPTVSTATATAIVVADMVGVGVFTSLGYQVQDIPSGFSLLLLWIVGGIVALCGVAAYSELAGMFPRSSGEYNYLARSYHPAIGFLAGWLSATVGFAAPIALAAMAFGEYFKALVPGAPALALGLVFVMYSYSGWNAATYIAGEIDDPHRSLPRALFAGTLIVLVLYVGLNAVFLYTTPMEKMAGQLDVAVIAGRYIFGDWGGRVVGGLICLGLVSSISAMMWIGPRVTMTMGEDIPMLRFFSRKSKNGVPTVAVLFQLVIVNLMLFTQSFEAVLDFIQFSLTICSFLAVLGVIKLRYTHPDLPRPYRAWGYPVTPVIFLLVTAFMLYYLIIHRPVQSLAGFAMMLAGLAVYGASHFIGSSPPAVQNVNRA